MQACRVLAIRHGQTQWNTIGRYQGSMNSPLTDEGELQARQLAAGLVARFTNEKPSALYSSDLGRAMQTAEPISRALGLSITKESRLQEKRLGIFEGFTEAQFRAKYPDEAKRYFEFDPDFAPEGAESQQQFFDRAISTIKFLADQHIDQTIVCVAHGGVMAMLYRAANKLAVNSKRDFTLHNASINEFLVNSNDIELVRWGDVAHLTMALPETDPYDAV